MPSIPVDYEYDTMSDTPEPQFYDVTLLDEHYRVLVVWQNVTDLDVQAETRAVAFLTPEGRTQLVLLSTRNTLQVLDVTARPSVPPPSTPSNFRRAALART